MQEPVPNHLQPAVRPILSSIQILARIHLGSNHNLATKPFIKGRDICLIHTSSISTGLRNTSPQPVSQHTKKLTLIHSRLLEMVSYPTCGNITNQLSNYVTHLIKPFENSLHTYTTANISYNSLNSPPCPSNIVPHPLLVLSFTGSAHVL